MGQTLKLTPYYSDESVTLFNCDFRYAGLLGPAWADAIIADPPYGETSLVWDVWPEHWPAGVDFCLKRSGSTWCFGSFRMFTKHWSDFDLWKMSQDVVWEKHNGSSFHADRFKRVHELAVHFWPAKTKWADVFKSPVTTNDATKRTTRRKKRPPHMGNIGASDFTSEDGGPRLMRSVMPVRSCHGYAKNETQKPIDLIKPLIQYCCPPGGTILVPFAGAGSELLAAKQMGMKAIGFEIRESQCEAAADRLRQGVIFDQPSSIAIAPCEAA